MNAWGCGSMSYLFTEGGGALIVCGSVAAGLLPFQCLGQPIQSGHYVIQCCHRAPSSPLTA